MPAPPTFLDRARVRLASGAAAAGRLIGGAGTAIIRAAAPFSGQTEGPANIPPAAYNADQPPPPDPTFDPKYHGHTFKAFAAPLAFSGWSIERIRGAIDQHDEGLFLESSTLAITVTRFAPVTAALGQRIAPALALPRKFRLGRVGLAKLVGAEVEAQLAPRAGLLPSIWFPSTLWGSLAIDFATMGFAVLQHAYGDPDPETGIRPIFTRRWPTWAVIYYRHRRTFQAITMDGPVDIISGDGKWTLVADSEEPHFDGAIRALGIPVLDGTLTLQARSAYIKKYGNPKWVGILPEKVATFGPEGDAFFKALGTIRGPDGFGALPYGSDFKTVALSGEASGVFRDALESVWQYVAAILLGSDGTMSKGSGGVYSAPIFAGVRRDLVARMLMAIVRGVNAGHVSPWTLFNYLEGIEQAKARGIWVDPVLEIPLPDPEADARIDSYAKRVQALHAIVTAERAAGFLVDQERVGQLAAQLDVDEPTLADVAPKGGEIFEWHVKEKQVAPDEVRDRLNLAPLPDGVGSVEQLAKERAEGHDKTGGGGGAGGAGGLEEAVDDANEDQTAGAGAEGGASTLATRADAWNAGVGVVGKLSNTGPTGNNRSMLGLAFGLDAVARAPAPRLRTDKDARGHGSDPRGGPKAKAKTGTKDGLGRSKAAGDARQGSKDAAAASDAAKAGGSHDEARKANEKAAEQHRTAAKASRKPEYREAHEKAAQAHDDLAKEHAALHNPHGAAGVEKMNVEKGLPADSGKKLVDGVKDKQIRAALEKHPIPTLTVGSKPVNHEPGQDMTHVLGLTFADHYQHGAEVFIDHAKHDSYFGGHGIDKWQPDKRNPFKDEKPHLTSTIGKDADEMRKMTFAHELGHHLAFSAYDKTHAITTKAYDKMMGTTRGAITQYAETNHDEYFAECHALYSHDAAKLKRADPIGHKMVKDVLKVVS